jgi:2-phosphosulfolactate phosphatase
VGGSRAARYLARWELDGVGGVVVAVDVLRAFTTAAYAFAAGASEIWLTAGVEEALTLGREIPGALVMGEDHGRRPAGFDLSNSPVEVARADVEGRVLVQRTSAGTQGVIAATGAERLFAASLVCASVTATAITNAGLGAPTYVITGRFPATPRVARTICSPPSSSSAPAPAGP